MKTESNKFKGTVSHDLPYPTIGEYSYSTPSWSLLSTTSNPQGSTATANNTPATDTSNANSNLTSWLNFGENIATTLGGVATAIWGSNPAPTPQPAGNNNNNNNNNSGGSSAGLFIGLGLGALVLIILLVVLLKK